ncbi:hypothetical protein KR054_012155 [Drosophila jambulina]|nr:hypothetical protein KR054_012155 [Drosophila jambulina]
MSDEETEVKNASTQEENRRGSGEFGESDDDYSKWLTDEKKRKKSEANRRYREKLKLRFPKPRAKTPAENCKAYRERKKLKQIAEAETTPSSSVLSNILNAMNDDPESDQYEAEIRYQQFLPKEPSPQSVEYQNYAYIQEASVQEIQTDSDDSNVPLKRRKTDLYSSSEVNFDELQEDSVQDSISTGNQSGSDCISERDIVPTTEEFANMSPAGKAAEAARRYRLMKKIKKPAKPPALTAAERSKAYRERQKSLQTAAKIITKDSKINLNKKQEATQEVVNEEQVKENAIKKQRRPKAPPKTPAEKSREYRERKKRLILAAVEDITIKQQINSNLEKKVSSEIICLEMDADDSNDDRKTKNSIGDSTCEDEVEKRKHRRKEYDHRYREKHPNKSDLAKQANKDYCKRYRDKRRTFVKQSIEDTNESANTGAKKRLRNVLTLDERVAAIQQYDIEPMCGQIAGKLNCSLEQIKSVVSNRKAILEFNEATIKLSMQVHEDHELRRRKLNLLSYCLYEYSQRAQYHLGQKISNELVLQRAIEFRDLMGIVGFTPNKSWISQVMAAYNISSSTSQIETTKRPRNSLDLKNIMTHCVQQSAMATNLKPNIPETAKIDMEELLNHSKNLENTSVENQGTSIDLESDDDCVAIKIEDTDDINNSPRIPFIQELVGSSHRSSLKIEKLQHSPIHISDYQAVDVEMPESKTSPNPIHKSEDSDEAPLPRSVDSFKDALRLLKPLEDFALMRENYRVIGLLSQLEQIFEAGKKAEDISSPV